MKNRALLFDMDGTLLNTSLANYSSYKKAAEAVFKKKFPISEKDFKTKYNGKNYRSFLSEIFPGIKESDLAKIHRIKKSTYIDFLDTVSCNTALFDLINANREYYKIGLVTSASKENVDLLLKRFNKVDFFDVIITGDDVLEKKPHPECYFRAAKQLGVKPENCVAFEDSLDGIAAAKLSGCQVLIIDFVKD